MVTTSKTAQHSDAPTGRSFPRLARRQTSSRSKICAAPERRTENDMAEGHRVGLELRLRRGDLAAQPGALGGAGVALHDGLQPFLAPGRQPQAAQLTAVLCLSTSPWG